MYLLLVHNSVIKTAKIEPEDRGQKIEDNSILRYALCAMPYALCEEAESFLCDTSGQLERSFTGWLGKDIDFGRS